MVVKINAESTCNKMADLPLHIGNQAIRMRCSMKEITVLLLDQMFSSTAIGPMEVFRHAGSLWNSLTGTQLTPRFRVTMASADGRPVNCDGGIQIRPNVALRDVGKTDLIFVPTTGLSVDDVVE